MYIRNIELNFFAKKTIIECWCKIRIVSIVAIANINWFIAPTPTNYWLMLHQNHLSKFSILG